MFQDKIIQVVWGKIVKEPEDVGLSFGGLARHSTLGSHQGLYMWVSNSDSYADQVDNVNV